MTAPARADERADLDPDWRERAACRAVPTRDADAAFFPAQGHRAGRVAEQTAIRWCAGCPVRSACRADSPDQVGVWGGEYRRLQDRGHLAVTDYLVDPPATTVRKVTR